MRGDRGILMRSIEDITEERGNVYGTPLVNHTRTAGFWSVLFGVEVTAEQVCLANVLQKISREMHGAKKEDTLDDIEGFIRNIRSIRGETK